VRNSYTTFSPPIRKAAKLAGLSVPEFAEIVRVEFAEAKKLYGASDRKRIESPLCQLRMVAIDLLVLMGRSVHLFMPGKGFCDWLISCVSRFERPHTDAVKELLDGRIVGVLHFPCSSGLQSVAFTIGPKEWDIDNCSYLEIQASGGVGSIGYSSVCLSDKKDYDGSPEMQYGKLIVGLGMYCNCFPETLKEGPPQDVKHPSMHAYENSKTVGISAKIHTGGTHDSPIAHFRRGHFRVLRSEKFTHKRFQAVFVRETFVAGKAKTVLSPEEVLP
jgi:hypothetical protein